MLARVGARRLIKASRALDVVRHDISSRFVGDARAFATTAWTTRTTRASAGARGVVDDLASLASTRQTGATTRRGQVVVVRGYKKAHRKVEVILLRDVDGLGKADDVADVKPGRARNHLVPMRLATYVNEEKLAASVARKESRARENESGVELESEEIGEGKDAAEEARERKVGLRRERSRGARARWSWRVRGGIARARARGLSCDDDRNLSMD